MSIALSSIDCPYLTDDCRKNLIEQHDIHTTNDFLLWLKKDSTDFSLNIIECIQSCIIAHTASISHREISHRKCYKVNYSLFDNENLFENNRHLIFLYESFNQNQWNDFFNLLLLRLYFVNQPIQIKYLNTNMSLFDIGYFYSNYCPLISIPGNDFMEKFFYFDHCLTLEAFENELNLLEKNSEDIKILIIDDLFTLIKPYLNLDRRIKGKILQLTYRLNRLAQKQSILILTGIIFNTKKRIQPSDYDIFHADRYVLFQSLRPMEKNISVRFIPNDQSTKVMNLDEWRNLKSNSFVV